MTTDTTPKKGRAPKGLGGVFERDGLWYIRFRYKGRRYRESTGSRRKKVAIDLLKKRIAEVQDSTFSPAGSRMKLKDLLRLTTSNYEKNGRRSIDRLGNLHSHLERLLGADTPVDQIHERIDAYTTKRRDEGANPGTINRELSALRRGFRLAIKARRLATMPLFELFDERDYVRTGFPEPEEVERIIDELPDRMKPVARFLSISGWRLGEALGLEWRNVDAKAGEIRIERTQTKGREVRIYPYGENAELTELIEERRAATKAWSEENDAIVPLVFWHPGVDDQRRPVALPNELHWASKAFRLAAKRAKCGHIRCHDLRRYVARRLIRSGVEESVAMKLLGHKTASVFKRYNITDGRDLRDAVRTYSEATPRRAEEPRERKA
jgi:integrase